MAGIRHGKKKRWCKETAREPGMNEKPRREVGEDPQGKKKADTVIEKCTGK